MEEQSLLFLFSSFFVFSLSLNFFLPRTTIAFVGVGLLLPFFDSGVGGEERRICTQSSTPLPLSSEKEQLLLVEDECRCLLRCRPCPLLVAGVGGLWVF